MFAIRCCPICDKEMRATIRMCSVCYKLYRHELNSDWFLYLERVTKLQEFISKKECFTIRESDTSADPIFTRSTGKPIKVSSELRKYIKGLKEKNPSLSLREIARQVKVSHVTVKTILSVK